MADIHNYKRRLELVLLRVEKKVGAENKSTIIEFYNYCLAEGLSPGKLSRYIDDLITMDKWFGKKFETCNKKDVERLIARLETSEYAEWTKYGFKVIVRKFFKWLRNSEELPEEVKWIRLRMKNSARRLPEELLTETEVRLLIEHSEKARDRAIIASLYESGCRICELLNLKIKHLIFDKYGAVATVSGKTGSRRTRLIFSVQYIQEWLNNHPRKDNVDSYLFVKGDGEIMGYNRVKDILQLSAKKAGIKKKVNPHNFRHSRATYLANHLTEAQLKSLFGWAQSSKMASVYIHLSGKEVDSTLLKMHGIEIVEDDPKEKLSFQTCLRCKTKNEATNKFCKLCGFILNKEEQEKLIKQDFERADMDNLMSNLLKDKEIMELLARKLKEKVDA